MCVCRGQWGLKIRREKTGGLLPLVCRCSYCCFRILARSVEPVVADVYSPFQYITLPHVLRVYFALIKTFDTPTHYKQRQEMLNRRVGEHKSRLDKQETGLRSISERISQLEAECKVLRIAVDLLSSKKNTLLARTRVTNGSSSGRGGGDAGSASSSGEGERCGMTDDSVFSMEKVERTTRENLERVAELEKGKERLQNQCRKLQVRGALQACVS